MQKCMKEKDGGWFTLSHSGSCWRCCKFIACLNIQGSLAVRESETVSDLPTCFSPHIINYSPPFTKCILITPLRNRNIQCVSVCVFEVTWAVTSAYEYNINGDDVIYLHFQHKTDVVESLQLNTHKPCVYTAFNTLHSSCKRTTSITHTLYPCTLRAQLDWPTSESFQEVQTLLLLKGTCDLQKWATTQTQHTRRAGT